VPRRGAALRESIEVERAEAAFFAHARHLSLVALWHFMASAEPPRYFARCAAEQEAGAPRYAGQQF